MRLKFWGTRGSISTPGKETVRYGGNTPCIELRLSNDELIILDAGTGIRNLGEKLIENGESINTHFTSTLGPYPGISFFQTRFYFWERINDCRR